MAEAAERLYRTMAASREFETSSERLLKRGVAAFCSKGLDFRMLSLHDMDRATDDKRKSFLERVRRAVATL